MKRLVISTIVMLALASTPTALAQGTLGVVHAGVTRGHMTATWSGPPTDFGAIEFATRPDTGSDGHFFAENRVQFDMTTNGQTSWLDSYPLAPPKRAGTYVGYVRVSGWDPQARFVDYGYGITDWLGDYVFSPVQQFTLIGVAHRVLVTRGHYVKRGKRRVWVRPVYRTTYSWADS